MEKYKSTKQEKQDTKEAIKALKIIRRFAKKYYGQCKKEDYCIGCVSCLFGRALDDIEGLIKF